MDLKLQYVLNQIAGSRLDSNAGTLFEKPLANYLAYYFRCIIYFKCLHPTLLS